MEFIVALIISYLIGSIPFGLILSRLSGFGDIREIGSGNIGATNVLRTGNKGLAFATLMLDGMKGAFAIAMLSMLAPALLVGLFAILGHCFPVWLKFKGGKGVATTFGVLLVATPWAGLIAAVTWGIVAGFTRISSLSALSAAAIAPAVTLIYYGLTPAAITLLITVLVFWRHKENIQRLMKGEESKIGSKKKDNNEPAADKE